MSENKTYKSDKFVIGDISFSTIITGNQSQYTNVELVDKEYVKENLISVDDVADKIIIQIKDDPSILNMVGKYMFDNYIVITNAEIFNDYDNNKCYGNYSHCEGYNNIINSEQVDNTTVTNNSYSHCEGYTNIINGLASHCEGYNNNLKGNYSHCEGYNNTLNGNNIHCQGYNNNVSGSNLFIIGNNNNYDNNINNKIIIGNYCDTITDDVILCIANGKENNNNNIITINDNVNIYSNVNISNKLIVDNIDINNNLNVNSINTNEINLNNSDDDDNNNIIINDKFIDIIHIDNNDNKNDLKITANDIKINDISLIDIFYPVGSIYLTINNNSDNDNNKILNYPGTEWKLLCNEYPANSDVEDDGNTNYKGRFIRINNIGLINTGGNNTIDISKIPPHKHQYQFNPARRCKYNSNDGYSWNPRIEYTSSTIYNNSNVAVTQTPYLPEYIDIVAYYRVK